MPRRAMMGLCGARYVRRGADPNDRFSLPEESSPAFFRGPGLPCGERDCGGHFR